MNKKGGVENQQLIFFLFEIMLGGLILLGVTHLVIGALSDSQEEILAKDLALSVGTMISSPNKLYFKYAPDTQEYDIAVNEIGEISVKSKDGIGVYNYVPLEGVKVKPTLLRAVLSVPMQFENNELIFESQNPDDAIQFCSHIPNTFGKKTKVSIDIVNRYIASKKSLEFIRDQVTALNGLDKKSPIEIVPVYDPADIRLILTFKEISNEDDLVLEYFSEEEIPNHQRVSCFLASEFLGIEGDYFSTYKDIPEKTTKQITVYMGSWKGFEEKSNEDPNIFEKYSLAILNGLKKGVSN